MDTAVATKIANTGWIIVIEFIGVKSYKNRILLMKDKNDQKNFRLIKFNGRRTSKFCFLRIFEYIDILNALDYVSLHSFCVCFMVFWGSTK